MIRLSGPLIYTENGVIKNADLIISNEKIGAIETRNKSASPDLIVFPESYHLLPGFIDVHMHGAGGFDVMDGTAEALKSISQALVAEGTTSWLATTMTASSEIISDVVSAVGAFIQQETSPHGARILGVHLEGPFLSPEKVGAQDAKHILLPDMHLLREWQKVSNHAIRLVTLAPELLGSHESIHFLRSENIVASIGHSNATYAETLAAVDAGCSHVTHLFNAMRGMHQREPGLVTAALLSEKLSTELIVDGVHLHPAILDLVLKLKSREKILLVTDAMRAKCLADGEYDLGGQMVSVRGNVASLADGTLAGSVLRMISAVQNMIAFTDCSMMDVVRFSAENPAKMLGVFDKKGSILPGKDADLVVLDENLNVVMTIVAGRVVYKNA